MLAISSLCACAVQNWPKSAQNDWRHVGRPSSCNAFAIATLSIMVGINSLRMFSKEEAHYKCQMMMMMTMLMIYDDSRLRDMSALIMCLTPGALAVGCRRQQLIGSQLHWHCRIASRQASMMSSNKHTALVDVGNGSLVGSDASRRDDIRFSSHCCIGRM